MRQLLFILTCTFRVVHCSAKFSGQDSSWTVDITVRTAWKAASIMNKQQEKKTQVRENSCKRTSSSESLSDAFADSSWLLRPNGGDDIPASKPFTRLF